MWHFSDLKQEKSKENLNTGKKSLTFHQNGYCWWLDKDCCKLKWAMTLTKNLSRTHTGRIGLILSHSCKFYTTFEFPYHCTVGESPNPNWSLYKVGFELVNLGQWDNFVPKSPYVGLRRVGIWLQFILL